MSKHADESAPETPTDYPGKPATLQDYLVDMSHAITTHTLQGPDGQEWTPVGKHDSPDNAYRHGVCNGVQWLLEALVAGGKNPQEVLVTSDILDALSGVMHYFGEPAGYPAVLALDYSVTEGE